MTRDRPASALRVAPGARPDESPGATAEAWTREEFEGRLREKGRAYHIHHPFNLMLNSGKAAPEQIRGWVANRFYYQINIPVKDAAILSNCDDRAVRRNWVQRILDHDGYGDDPGGIDSWLRLAEAVGLTRERPLRGCRGWPVRAETSNAPRRNARPGKPEVGRAVRAHGCR